MFGYYEKIVWTNNENAKGNIISAHAFSKRYVFYTLTCKLVVMKMKIQEKNIKPTIDTDNFVSLYTFVKIQSWNYFYCFTAKL